MGRDGTLDRLVDLRLRRLSGFPEYRRDRAARRLLRQQLADCLSTAQWVETYGRGEAIAGAVILTAPEKSIRGLDQVLCLVECNAEDDQARGWCAQTLQRLARRFDDRHALLLSVAHRALLPELLRLGLGIDTLLLHGEPETALQRLGGPARAAQGKLRDADLNIAPLGSAQQVEQILALRSSYFAANPQFAPGNPSTTIGPAQQERIDAFVGAKLIAQLEQDPATHFVVLRGATVLGSFGLTVTDNALLGRCAGVEIALDPSIHGHGLARLAYGMLLQRMIELRVDLFRGRTAHPAVIHLARRMRRPLRGWWLCSTPKALPPDHFDYPVDR
jgi:hypothetical protein